jgi:glycine cleavage system regulatory protein
MDYELAIENTPDTIPGGTGVLLVHPSTGETDRIDTDFLKTDTDHLLVVSTRTTAREVQQKLEHYGVDEDRAVILDTLSVERGYSRRSSDRVHYVAAPDDLDGIVAQVEQFLERHDGKLRVSLDSITEMAYYADEDRAREAVERILALLGEHDAVGLFHLAEEVHDPEVLTGYRERFDGSVVTLASDGTVTAEF